MEIGNLLKKMFLYILLKSPDIKILPDSLAIRIHKAFRKFYDHDVVLQDLEVIYDPQNKNLASDISKKIKKYGLIVLKNFNNQDVAKRNGLEILDYVSSKYLYIKSNYHEFDDGSVLQREPYKVKSYDDFLEKEATLINIRGRKNIDDFIGDDSGLIDIFHVKKILSGENKTFIENFESNNSLLKILKSINKKLVFKSVNFYFNAGKTDPRGLHIDTPTREYKLFHYLTDVIEESDGPYTFVPKSNKKTLISLFNMVINKFSSKKFQLTDINFSDNSQALKIFGSAGDLIISNQSAAHGGTPQTANSSRLILVGIIH